MPSNMTTPEERHAVAALPAAEIRRRSIGDDLCRDRVHRDRGEEDVANSAQGVVAHGVSASSPCLRTGIGLCCATCSRPESIVATAGDRERRRHGVAPRCRSIGRRRASRSRSISTCDSGSSTGAHTGLGDADSPSPSAGVAEPAAEQDRIGTLPIKAMPIPTAESCRSTGCHSACACEATRNAPPSSNSPSE